MKLYLDNKSKFQSSLFLSHSFSGSSTLVFRVPLAWCYLCPPFSSSCLCLLSFFHSVYLYVWQLPDKDSPPIFFPIQLKQPFKLWRLVMKCHCKIMLHLVFNPIRALPEKAEFQSIAVCATDTRGELLRLWGCWFCPASQGSCAGSSDKVLQLCGVSEQTAKVSLLDTF